MKLVDHFSLFPVRPQLKISSVFSCDCEFLERPTRHTRDRKQTEITHRLTGVHGSAQTFKTLASAVTSRDRLMLKAVRGRSMIVGMAGVWQFALKLVVVCSVSWWWSDYYIQYLIGRQSKGEREGVGSEWIESIHCPSATKSIKLNIIRWHVRNKGQQQPLKKPSSSFRHFGGIDWR